MTTEREMRAFYDKGSELDRLAKGIGPLELARTQELIERFIRSTPATIYDIGGAHGVYSFWLAGMGYDVHLVDIVPLHIEHARRIAGNPTSPQLAGMQVGDARCLPFAGESADVMILHGPLYHLTEYADRMAALREAYRVLRPGGLLLAFTISNYASTIVGITNGSVWDSDYLSMCEGEIETRDHRRPISWPSLFSTAYFHHPDQTVDELERSGFVCEGVLGVQGRGWMVPDFEANWQNADRREVILRIARQMEREPVLSPHHLAVARR
jgi:SAM-dependent methyltransferase